MMEQPFVGKSVIRIDALEKVTGKTIFCTDYKLPGMLHAKVLRSPLPHAKIIGVNISKAKRLPGVRSVVIGKDAPEVRYGILLSDQHVLARERVRFAGEPVAAVAADSPDIASEALGLIEVHYEALPPLLDPYEAMSINPKTIIHPDLFKYSKAREWSLDVNRPNVFLHHKIRRGDVDQAFQKANLVIENEFTTGRIQHCSLEPHASIVAPADGSLTIWSGRQDVWLLKNTIGILFGMKPSQIRVIRPYVGGAFGSKIPLVVEPIAALLALKCQKPVKIVLTREEVFLGGGNRVPMSICIKDGVSKTGRLIARKMKVILRAGAYSGIITAIVRNSSFGSVGSYNVPNFRWDSYGVYSNEPPACNFRGFGSTQVIFAIESQMDMLAQELEIDPIEFRKKNILEEGKANITGEITHSIGSRKCLDEMKDFMRPINELDNQTPWRRGRGVALGNKYCSAPSAALARVKVAEDGYIFVYHSADDIGQGCNTVAAQIVANEFDVPIDMVKIVFEDTLFCPFFQWGSTSSRTTYMLGNAIKAASVSAKKRLFEIAAVALQTTPFELETKGGVVFVKGSSTKEIKITEIFSGFRADRPGGYGSFVNSGEILGEAAWVQESTLVDPHTGLIDANAALKGMRLVSFWSHTAKAVEIALNIETGHIRILRFRSADDMGQPINPKMCEQQLEGGMGMGIGDSLFEEMEMKDGILKNADFIDYRLPSTLQMPLKDDVELIFAPAAHKDGPFGAKGIGETAIIGIQPAIANAIYDAVGVRIRDLPIKPENVLRALSDKIKSK
jgi:CO/xanthine dehydrogenase Mo-binding subunit